MSRKYVIVVPDGAADKPIEVFGGKTIFEIAEKPSDIARLVSESLFKN